MVIAIAGYREEVFDTIMALGSRFQTSHPGSRVELVKPRVFDECIEDHVADRHRSFVQEEKDLISMLHREERGELIGVYEDAELEIMTGFERKNITGTEACCVIVPCATSALYEDLTLLDNPPLFMVAFNQTERDMDREYAQIVLPSGDVEHAARMLDMLVRMGTRLEQAEDPLAVFTFLQQNIGQKAGSFGSQMLAAFAIQYGARFNHRIA